MYLIHFMPEIFEPGHVTEKQLRVLMGNISCVGGKA